MTESLTVRSRRAGPTEVPARWTGLAVAAGLIVLAGAVPVLLGWHVHAGKVPPLSAYWRPHVGPGTVPALAVGVLAVLVGQRFAARARWRLVLVTSFVVGLAWIVGLAMSDGPFGIARVLDWKTEYLPTAREVTDIGATLHGYIERIPLTVPDRWPVNIAGHPPGALLFFVLLVRIGLGSSLASGLVVILIAATTPLAVLIALRRLGAEAAARRAAPLLVLAPSAVWSGVSGDAVAAAAGAWGLCCLAVAATAVRGRGPIAATAGLLLGAAVMLSYGAPLLGLLAVAILVAARSWRPLVAAVPVALAVVLGFAVAGFAWWDAYPVVLGHYRAGLSRLRPFGYWVWADLALLALAAGPVLGAGLATALVRRRAGRLSPVDRVVVLLTAAAALIIGLADASGLSKAEVERIWLPFFPWLLVSTALLPERWRRLGLAAGVLLGFGMEHLLRTIW